MSLSEFVDRHQNASDAKVHSNIYAKVAQEGETGSVSLQSFDDRIRLERSRRSVRGYGHSLIGGGYVKEAARERMNANRLSVPGSRGGEMLRSRQARPTMPARTFREPPARYNPYG